VEFSDQNVYLDFNKISHSVKSIFSTLCRFWVLLQNFQYEDYIILDGGMTNGKDLEGSWYDLIKVACKRIKKSKNNLRIVGGLIKIQNQHLLNTSQDL
jgi:hypothetical protein